MKDYIVAFSNFKSEAGQLADAECAKYNMSQEFNNVVLMSGEIIGRDTEKKLKEIGRKYGLLTLADNLTILYR